MTKPNHIRVSPHFQLYEFEDKAAHGLVVLHPIHLTSLEMLRATLCQHYTTDVQIFVTSGTRLESSNAALALELGWIHKGGSVSPTSKHLPCYGGIASDINAFIASLNIPVPTNILFRLARPIFAFVLEYPGSHIHVDSRNLINLKGPHIDPSKLA